MGRRLRQGATNTNTKLCEENVSGSHCRAILTKLKPLNITKIARYNMNFLSVHECNVSFAIVKAINQQFLFLHQSTFKRQMKNLPKAKDFKDEELLEIIYIPFERA